MLFSIPGSHPSYHIPLRSPSAPLGCDSFSVSLFGMIVLRNIGQWFSRIFFSRDLPGGLSMIGLRLWIVQRKITELKCRFHRSDYRYQHDFSLLIVTLRLCLSGFPSEMVLVSPFPCSVYSLGEIHCVREFTLCSHRLGDGGRLPSTFLRAEYPRKLFGILLHGRFVFSPMYLLIQ